MFYTYNDHGIVTVPAVVFGHGSLTHAYVLPETNGSFETPHELVIAKLVPILGWLAEQDIPYRLRVVSSVARMNGQVLKVMCLTPAIDFENDEAVVLAKMRWS